MDSIVDLLTDSNGNHAVGESDIRDAINLIKNIEAENAHLRAAVAEMQRMLTVIERVELMGNGGVWATLTAGTEISTPTQYRAALETALAKIEKNK